MVVLSAAAQSLGLAAAHPVTLAVVSGQFSLGGADARTGVRCPPFGPRLVVAGVTCRPGYSAHRRQ